MHPAAPSYTPRCRQPGAVSTLPGPGRHGLGLSVASSFVPGLDDTGQACSEGRSSQPGEKPQGPVCPCPGHRMALPRACAEWPEAVSPQRSAAPPSEPLWLQAPAEGAPQVSWSGTGEETLCGQKAGQDWQEQQGQLSLPAAHCQGFGTPCLLVLGNAWRFSWSRAGRVSAQREPRGDFFPFNPFSPVFQSQNNSCQKSEFGLLQGSWKHWACRAPQITPAGMRGPP